MTRGKIITWLLLLFLHAATSLLLPAQPRMQTWTLQDALERGKNYSLDALNAKETFRASYWEYRSFKSSMLPHLGATTDIPVYNRSVTPVTDPYTGIERYVPQQYAQYGADLSLSQLIAPTGGHISLYSRLERTDNFTPDSNFASYYTVPIILQLTQPILKFNPSRWDRKIKPIAYDQAKRNYLEQLQTTNIRSTNMFFDLLKAQIEYKIAVNNQAINDTNFRIAKGRYAMGKIMETDLLQFELQYIQAEAILQSAVNTLESKEFQFRSFFRLTGKDSIILVPPSELDVILVDPQLALNEALRNSSLPLDYKRQLLEASMDVNSAKRTGRFSADLSASIGWDKSTNPYLTSDPSLREAYDTPQEREYLALKLNIPILDWGEARGRIKMAQNREEVTKNRIEQLLIDFESDVRLKVARFNIQKKQVEIASKSVVIAAKTYEVAVARYRIGKDISVMDLIKMQNTKDDNETAYYSSLQTYWTSYFDLLRSTLYDFKNGQPLQFNFGDVKP